MATAASQIDGAPAPAPAARTMAAPPPVAPATVPHRQTRHISIAAMLLPVALLVASALQPAWVVSLLLSLPWFGGAWRPLALPFAVVVLAALIGANARRPGAAPAALSGLAPPVRRWTLVLLAAGVAL